MGSILLFPELSLKGMLTSWRAGVAAGHYTASKTLCCVKMGMEWFGSLIQRSWALQRAGKQEARTWVFFGEGQLA
jgi:hypothetical protein